jgi:AcrR family transcriptional regulator
MSDQRKMTSPHRNGRTPQRHVRRPNGTSRLIHGAQHARDPQRARMIAAMVDIVAEHGYRRASVTLVVTKARTSRTTFYEHFGSANECYLAAIDLALARLGEVAAPEYERPGNWVDRMRAALVAVLKTLDTEPTMASLLFVDALQAGPTVYDRRARVVELLRAAVDEGRRATRPGRTPASLTAETLVGGALTLIQSRLMEPRRVRLITLVNPLMSMIVLPYLGPAAARKELERPAPKGPDRSGGVNGWSGACANALNGLSIRVTYRTLRVLVAVGETPGACNRAIADAAGVMDQGQISRLLSRLQDHGLIHTVGDRSQWDPHHWYLTGLGEEVERAIRFDFAT